MARCATKQNIYNVRTTTSYTEENQQSKLLIRPRKTWQYRMFHVNKNLAKIQSGENLFSNQVI